MRPPMWSISSSATLQGGVVAKALVRGRGGFGCEGGLVPSKQTWGVCGWHRIGFGWARVRASAPPRRGAARRGQTRASAGQTESQKAARRAPVKDVRQWEVGQQGVLGVQ